MSHTPFLLKLSCVNRPGIVARVTTELLAHGGNILEAHQFDDTETGQFFMRIIFNLPDERRIDAFRSTFSVTGAVYGMKWELRSRDLPQNVLVLASRFDHCLIDLLYRVRIGELKMNVVGVISNYPAETYSGINLGSTPFHYLPVSKENKRQQEGQLKQIVKEACADLVVLARYMQILSEELAVSLSGRCINIHHGFLPSFKGAKPYHQAHARGVKLIGATAHYVTPDLDEGPIIEQDVERISHNDTVEDLVCKGRDIERRVLARAVTLHLQGRAMLNGHKTVVFRD